MFNKKDIDAKIEVWASSRGGEQSGGLILNCSNEFARSITLSMISSKT